jgi:hypothetical protein
MLRPWEYALILVCVLIGALSLLYLIGLIH